MRDKKHIRELYQARFNYILVDGIKIPATSIRLATKRWQADYRVMIVGDIVKSIYGWRGAKIENIQKFLDEFPRRFNGSTRTKLPFNQTILQASNELISNNTERMGKKELPLMDWMATDGEPISFTQLITGLDEARFLLAKSKSGKRKAVR